jgi:hypothetical protein
MIFPHRHILLRALVLSALPLIAACENSATSMTVDNKDHSLVLVREQPYFWNDEVKQYIVVSRLPACQRRMNIHPDKVAMTPVSVFDANHPLLWALNQGGQWYLASTEECKVQNWDAPNPQQLGSVVGRFEQRNGKTVFTPSPNPVSPPGH